jgi:hypothetical protein
MAVHVGVHACRSVGVQCAARALWGDPSGPGPLHIAPRPSPSTSSMYRNTTTSTAVTYIAKFSGVQIGSAVHEAVGIYKFDEKEVFIESKLASGLIELSMKRGLGNNKPNKAVLVVFTGNTHAFRHRRQQQHGVLAEGLHRSQTEEGQREQHQQRVGPHQVLHHQQLPQDYQIAKADQIDLLNRSVQYFKSHSEFDKQASSRRRSSRKKGAIRSFNQYSDRFPRKSRRGDRRQLRDLVTRCETSGTDLQERDQAGQELPHLHPRRPQQDRTRCG